jgi:(p)ppGpp synthase/HD superfamily hydrolase
MLDLSRYQKTIKFAGERHSRQKVPGSEANYLLHLCNVATEIIAAYMKFPNFDLNTAVQLALLHDTLEDTESSFSELKDHFGLKIAKNVETLTKDLLIPNEVDRIMDSLKRIKGSCKEVVIVKLCDRIVNLQNPPSYWSSKKVLSYKREAQLIAEELKGYHDYLDARIKEKIKNYNN